MKISEKIKKDISTLEERGLHDKSFFHVQFTDGSEVKEHDMSWSDMAEEVVVQCGDRKKRVQISKYPIKKIIMQHGTLQTEMEYAEGEVAYQGVRSIAYSSGDGLFVTKVVGRLIGKIKNGCVIEEKLLSNETNEVHGIKL